LEPGFGRGGFGEDLGEAAAGDGGADVGGVAGLLEQVRVDVESDRRACVAEDAADLADVAAERGFVAPRSSASISSSLSASVVSTPRPVVIASASFAAALAASVEARADRTCPSSQRSSSLVIVRCSCSKVNVTFYRSLQGRARRRSGFAYGLGGLLWGAVRFKPGA
jgi:hypothetical protein